MKNLVLWAESEIDGAAVAVLCLKITNFKYEITNKSQIPKINPPNLPGPGIVWIFEFETLGVYARSHAGAWER